MAVATRGGVFVSPRIYPVKFGEPGVSDTTYPHGHLFRYGGPAVTAASFTTMFAACTLFGFPAIIPGGEYGVAGELVSAGDIEIGIDGAARIYATAPLLYLMKFDGECSISGSRLELDGAGLLTLGAGQVMHNTNRYPRISAGIKTRHALAGFTTGPNPSVLVSHGVDGDGFYDDCEAEDCTTYGGAMSGDAAAMGAHTAIVRVRNFRTSGTTGQNSHTLVIQKNKYAERKGGVFRGHPNALHTDAFKCDSARAEGGLFEGIARGATFGQETTDGVISGAICKDISLVGVTTDTTDGVGETPGRHSVLGCVMVRCGRAFRSTGSNLVFGSFQMYDCTDVSGWVAVAGEGRDVNGSNLDFHSSGSQDYTPILLTEGSRAKIDLKTFRHNSTRRMAIQTAEGTGSMIEYAGYRLITTDADLTPADTHVVVDCAVNGLPIDLDLPDAISLNEGWECEIVKLDNVQPVTITVNGGATGGIIVGHENGVTIPARARNKRLTVFSTTPAGAPLINRYRVTGVRPESTQLTTVGNVGAGTDDLHTYNIPAGTFHAAGIGVVVEAWGTYANNANAKSLRMDFGATAMVNVNLPINNGSAKWFIRAKIYSTGTDAQKFHCRLFDEGTADAFRLGIGTTAEDDGAVIDVRTRAVGVADNDVVAQGFTVRPIDDE